LQPTGLVGWDNNDDEDEEEEAEEDEYEDEDEDGSEEEDHDVNTCRYLVASFSTVSVVAHWPSFAFKAFE
jgi:hypothetical protein